MKKAIKTYYFKPVKIIRDLIHEYINLTAFEIELIDTVEFQRLKDIRQLTCQHVYPSARHTRFEHSLGVLELTKRAIEYINENGFIGNKVTSKPIISDNLLFNACIAALLHDVGHCPFSHMGETEFDSKEVRQALWESVIENDSLSKCEDLINKLKDPKSKIGAIHEQLSCITILTKYSVLLENLKNERVDLGDECEIAVDYELIIRSILGIEYNINNSDHIEENKIKNIIVNLINSKIFDMDKLDYIMRDSFFTGLATAHIDTHRLFRNMHLNDKYKIVFTIRAIPALQNMIDARDSLYMYVYNHHAVIFSEFMCTYSLRCMSHNARAFLRLIYPKITQEKIEDIEYSFNIMPLGLVPKQYLFSVDSVVGLHRSDSDWISLLNIIDTNRYFDDKVLSKLLKDDLVEYSGNKCIVKNNKKKIKELAEKIKVAFELIHNYKTRKYLRPWWKTVIKFNEFINTHFLDDKIREDLCKCICSDRESGLKASELRSQIAKHVIYLTQQLDGYNEKLLEAFQPGDFFVIQRTNSFLALDTIEKLQIALKKNEIDYCLDSVIKDSQKYYFRYLTKLVPQKDYSSTYSKNGFYVFSKPVKDSSVDEQMIKGHYELIEQIFVFVATELMLRGEYDFVRRFCVDLPDEEKEKNERESMEDMLKNFKEKFM